MYVSCNTTLLAFSLKQIRMKYPNSILSLHFRKLSHGLDDSQYHTHRMGLGDKIFFCMRDVFENVGIILSQSNIHFVPHGELRNGPSEKSSIAERVYVPAPSE